MTIEILMPALSPTMKEGVLANWLKSEGDIIEPGDVIAEIETDKATMEVEAVDEGILGKILVASGTENVAINTPIALMLEDGEDNSVLDSYKVSAPKSADNPTKEEVSTEKEEEKVVTPLTTETLTVARSALNDRIYASPLAKRVAAKNNVSLGNLVGSGPHGRIIKNDVLSAGVGQKSGTIQRHPEEYHAVKNNNIRKVIASRLLESKQNVPHFYLSLDLNIDKLIEMRKSINELAIVDDKGKPSYKLSVNDIVIKATALALKAVPEANSSWSDDAILLYNNIDVSVAVAIDGGLITPIIKNADQKSLIDISAEAKKLIKKARDGKLQPEEFQGGGFSISNLGMYGINSFQAIVNPPQSCILAIGAGIEKPIINKGGEITKATIMNVTLSSDHRSVDGSVGAEFLGAFKKTIENPISMLL
jgi:pyruvate dehydrogenase E2 component (dihydrolipoamide acetyltransferase)